MIIALIGFAAVLLLAFMRMPLGVALGLVGVVGFGMLSGFPAAIANASRLVIDSGQSYGLSKFPIRINHTCAPTCNTQLITFAPDYLHTPNDVPHCSTFGLSFPNSLLCILKDSPFLLTGVPFLMPRGHILMRFP